MGRRALPKIDPTIDYSEHLREVSELPAGFTIEGFFDRAAPTEIEIGSGKGLFLLNASGEILEHNFLGIEIAKKYARFSAFRLAKSNRSNAKILRGDGIKFCADFVGDESIHAFHVYFPDPWWKEKHRRRRVMRSDFVSDMQRMLIPGGVLHFWTDVEEYYETTVELLSAESSFESPIAVEPTEASHDMDYRTHFERRMRNHDHPVFRCQFVKPV